MPFPPLTPYVPPDETDVLPSSGTLILGFLSLPIVVGCGWLFHFWGRHSDDIPANVLIWTALACWLIGQVCYRTKIRHRRLAIWLGISVALLISLLRIGFDAEYYHRDLRQYLADVSRAGLNLRFDGHGFSRYNNLNGVQVTAGFDVTGPVVWGIVALETALAAVVGSLILVDVARRPYCFSCQRWKTRVSIPPWKLDRLDEVRELIYAQDWEQLLQLPRLTNRGTKKRVEMRIYQCDNCGEASLHLYVHVPLEQFTRMPSQGHKQDALNLLQVLAIDNTPIDEYSLSPASAHDCRERLREFA